MFARVSTEAWCIDFKKPPSGGFFVFRFCHTFVRRVYGDTGLRGAAKRRLEARGQTYCDIDVAANFARSAFMSRQAKALCSGRRSK